MNIETAESEIENEEEIIVEDESTLDATETPNPEETATNPDSATETDEAAGGEVEGKEVESEEEESTDEESVVIEIEGESPPEEDDDSTPLIKKLRKKLKDQGKKLKEFEANAPSVATASLPALGKEPEYEDTFDGVEFKASWNKWNALKQKHETAKSEAQSAKDEETNKWNERLKVYDEKKSALRVSDFDESESLVKETLDVNQQGIIVHGAKDPAMLAYALGKHPKLLVELSKEKDPVKFAFAMGGLEPKLKVGKRKAATEPERAIKGGASISSHDTVMAKLEAEADKTNDRTKIIAYRRKQRLAAEKLNQ